MSKIYIGLITDKGEIGNVSSFAYIAKYFDGLAVTYHGSAEDEEFKILDANKKDGFVELMKYTGDHSLSMNYFLKNPKIKIGDWILLRDSSERINEDFAYNIRPFIKMLENQGINTVYQYSKLLMFRRFPHQNFSSTPHWGFSGAQHKYVKIEEQNWFKDEIEYCYSLRKETRDQYHFVDAFMRYYLIMDSNHNLLGLENFGDPSELFPALEKQRISFLLYLKDLGINNDVNSLKEYFFKTNLLELPVQMVGFINSNLIINQFYRYNILHDLSVFADLKAPIVYVTQ